jgi:hypothetical protein
MQACRLESSPYIPPSQEKSTYLNSASFLKYSKLNQPMLFPSKISNHLSLINRTFPCLWDATTQKITGQYNMKRSIHSLTTKRQPIQPSKQWTKLFNISLKHCFPVADSKLRSTPNFNVNSSIGS